VQSLLIDECLSTALVQVAHAHRYAATHVVHMGWQGLKDWQLIPVIERQDYLFVTNNRSDFLKLYSRLRLHNGLIIILPSCAKSGQIDIFTRALRHLSILPDLINHVLEIDGPPSYPITTHPLAAPAA
jgi:predicted nuclease of predicted toxin-antitoxin system